jgi:mannose-6-phosphate isomerase-like protein (cupin superfamily)
MKLRLDHELASPTGGAPAFVGSEHGDGIELSFFVNRTAPGRGPSLHRHPYGEVFVVHEGDVTFTLGDETLTATGGEVVVVPPGTAHGFRNTGERPLLMVSIHPAATMQTVWLED